MSLSFETSLETWTTAAIINWKKNRSEALRLSFQVSGLVWLTSNSRFFGHIPTVDATFGPHTTAERLSKRVWAKGSTVKRNVSSNVSETVVGRPLVAVFLFHFVIANPRLCDRWREQEEEDTNNEKIIEGWFVPGFRPSPTFHRLSFTK